MAFFALLSFPVHAAAVAEQTQLGYLTTTGCSGASSCWKPYTSLNPLPVTASASAITGVLPVVNGGTGLSSLGSALQCLQVNGGGTALTYGSCGGGGSGTVGSGAIHQIGYYPATGTTISGDANFLENGINVNLLSTTGGYQIGTLNALKLTSTGNPILGDTAFNGALAPLSIAIGKNALASTTTGAWSVAVGHNALSANTSGIQSNAIGYAALAATTTGSDNNALGWSALTANTTGSKNVAIGTSALAAQTTATGNTAIGYNACNNITTGSGNTCLGTDSQALTATGNNDFVLGTSSQTVRVPGSLNAASFIPTGSTIPTDGLYLPAANASAIADRSLPVMRFTNPASAVNYWAATGSATGVALGLTATGSDTNIGLTITNKGTGQTTITSTGFAGSPLLVTGSNNGNGMGIAIQNTGSGGHVWSFTAEANSGGTLAGAFSFNDGTANATPFAVKSTGATSVLSTGIYGFSASTQYTDFTLDTSVSRAAAGSLAFGTGASGNTGAKVTAAGYISGGTKFTASGCSNSATLGGATMGHFTSGTTGTCTVVITMNGATGLSAPNGWICDGADRTTVPALFTGLFAQTGSSTTTATMAGTTVSGDDMQFKCMGY